MSETQPIVDALYSRFLLRDFAGKVVPGTVVLGSAGIVLTYPDSPRDAMASIPTFVWFVVLGLAWLLGFAVQSFGEALSLIRYYPKVGTKARLLDGIEFSAVNCPSNDQEFHADLSSFRTSRPADLQQLERFVVIKEACGNAYVALTLAAGTYFLGTSIAAVRDIGSGVFAWWLGEAMRLLPVGLLWVGAVVYLRRMHFIHVERQWLVVLGTSARRPSLPSNT